MRRRTLLTTAAGAALGLAAPLRGAQAQVADLNDAINKAGRQRMLSQRLGKAWLALAHKADTPAARTVLEQSLALFERQLGELKAYAPSPAIRDTYARLETAWADQKAALTGATPAREGAAALLRADARVLALAHQGTSQYEAALGKPVGHLVNVAGRQRMLSQRMAKFCLAAMLGVDAATAQAEIAQARGEFLAANTLLRQAPQATDRIRQELALADGQWVFFDTALQRLGGSGTGGGAGNPNTQRQVLDVFVSSENLLASMDRVTGMYAALSA